MLRPVPIDSTWHKRTVLITGIGGFVGGGLAKFLIRNGATVVGIVRDSRGSQHLESIGVREDVALAWGSITEPGFVQRVLNEYEVDTVFHLAAQAIVGVANRSPVSTFESNIAGTWQVLEAVRLTSTVGRVVVASSDKAYGDQPTLPYTEDTPLAGIFPYDASKVCADVVTRSYVATYQLPIALIRCANIYGPGDLNWSRLIPGAIRSVLAGEEPLIRSDGTPERDYIYLDDAVAGYVAIADHLPEAAGHAFNIGTEKSVSVLALVEQIIALGGNGGLRPRLLRQASGEIDRQCLSFKKAASWLGWRPLTSLPDGLASTIEWYRQYLEREALHAQEVAVS